MLRVLHVGYCMYMCTTYAYMYLYTFVFVYGPRFMETKPVEIQLSMCLSV